MNQRTKVSYLLGIILLISVQLAQAQFNFSGEKETTKNTSSAEDSNEDQNSAGDDILEIKSLIKPATQAHPHQAEQQIRTQSESEETTEDDYDPIRDNFYKQNEDGTYVYGYSLPHGVRRYERSFYSEKFKGLVVEGFYTQKRRFGQRLSYELRCYRSDYLGYSPLPVQYLSRPPVVERNQEPDVNCFDN